MISPAYMDDISSVETAESAVDDRMAGKISLYTGPFAEGGVPRKEWRWQGTLETIPLLNSLFRSRKRLGNREGWETTGLCAGKGGMSTKEKE